MCGISKGDGRGRDEVKIVKIELLKCRQCATLALSIGDKCIGGCGGPYYVQHTWEVNLERLMEDLQEVYGEQKG